MKEVASSVSGVKPDSKRPSIPEEAIASIEALDVRIALIQALIPIGLAAVSEQLQKAVEALAGPRYARKEEDQPYRRWGAQGGSVYLSDQKVAVSVPRVRDVACNQEVPSRSYEKLQQPHALDEPMFRRVLHGLSTRQYAECAKMAPQAFGLSSSKVSQRFIQVSSRKLSAFQERSLMDYDLVALYLDVKTFADEEMLIALGITISGEKVVLGITQTVSENERVCTQLLQKLVARGLSADQGLLVIIEGAKALANAVKKVFSGTALIQRCQWHKRENVVSYLAKADQRRIRTKLQKAYNHESYEKAKAALEAIKRELSALNPSAARSLEEGLEETLTLPRLGMMPYLKESFRTTNCIESLNSQVADLTRNVKRWTTANQRHRWLAAALMDLEPRLRKVMGFRYLPMPRQAIKRKLKLVQEVMTA